MCTCKCRSLKKGTNKLFIGMLQNFSLASPFLSSPLLSSLLHCRERQTHRERERGILSCESQVRQFWSDANNHMVRRKNTQEERERERERESVCVCVLCVCVWKYSVVLLALYLVWNMTSKLEEPKTNYNYFSSFMYSKFGNCRGRRKKGTQHIYLSIKGRWGACLLALPTKAKKWYCV